jgi:hypothetical protein
LPRLGSVGRQLNHFEIGSVHDYQKA